MILHGEIKGKMLFVLLAAAIMILTGCRKSKKEAFNTKGLKHYFLISFAQRPGALKEFVNDVLGPTDDITRFEYMQKQ